MKQLTDADLAEMKGVDFAPDDRHAARQVRAELKLSQLIPQLAPPVPAHVVLDLHQRTEEQAWDAINALLRSGARTATIITGASGILKVKFQKWMTGSIIAPLIASWHSKNNGSFEIKIRKNANNASY
jgi:DNA-nicking Smr family endonuclease